MSTKAKSTRKIQLRVSEELHAKIKGISPKGTFSDGVRVAAEAYGAGIQTIRAYDANGKPVGEWKADKT